MADNLPYYEEMFERGLTPTLEEPSDMRTVHQQDAVAWLQEQPLLSGCSLVTSLPDFSEFRGTAGGDPPHGSPRDSGTKTSRLEDWRTWFVTTARLVLSRCPPEGLTFFYQTDIKHEGVWIDKSFLCQQAAQAEGHGLLWHKIVCRCPPGEQTSGRPGYAHLLCFASHLRSDPSRAGVDVLTHMGDTTWPRGLGQRVCELCCRTILSLTPTRTVVAPFCGEGLLLAVANDLGLASVGIELSRKRAARARAVQLLSGKPTRRDGSESAGAKKP